MRALTELKKECMSRVISVTKHTSISCAICNENRAKRLLLHHYSYNNESVTYNQFENSDDGRLKYYSNIIDDVKKSPYNFEIFCVKCHNEVESQVAKSLETNEVHVPSHDYPLVFWTAVFITVQCRLWKTTIDSKEDYLDKLREFKKLYKIKPPCAFCDKLSTNEVTEVGTENCSEDIYIHHFPLCDYHKKINISDIVENMEIDGAIKYTVTASFPMHKDLDGNLKFNTSGLSCFFD
jgi:hypothetical protein